MGQLCTLQSLFNTPRAKRKRSPQPSVNSSTAENDCPYPARMANDNDDFKMWGSEIVKIFLEILVDEIKKEGPSMSKKDRSFFPRQWQTIDDEMTKKVGKNYGQKKLKGKFARLKVNYKEFVALKNHTGLGWDPITQTVTAPDDVWENYVQAHPNAKQFQTKGLEHYELLSEIFAKLFATGAFAHSSRQGAPTFDDEREMDERFHAYTSGKGVVDESINSGSKRKSSGQGQSSKNPKMDDALQSWQRSCEAREWFYLQAEANAGAADAYSVAACMTILKSMALDPSLFLKAMNMFTSLEWRTMFMTMELEMSMSSSRPNERQSNNMYDPYSDDDDDVMDLHMVCQLTRDIPTRQPQRNCLYTGTRNAGDRFQHSNETIHRHFVLMMRALGNLAPFVIQPPNMDVTHHKIRNDRRYWPWFKDCVGAIDGTHVVVVAPEGDQMPYRGRKVHTTQNVMAACSFDMKFTFVYTGWEGSAHDSRIFLKALTTNSADFSHPPPRYTHMPGYVAPYRGKKYHLQEFNRRRRYHGPQELFNHRHSSLRNVIERTFGVLKQQFPLLRHMSRYDMQDEFFVAEESSDENEDDVEDEDEDEDEDEGEGEGEGEGGGKGASQVQGEVGVQNVHRNEDGVPAMQQHNHVNMSREQLVQMGQWRDEVAASM
ncbi:unnamed protein product [Camellia sinensis]